jgi:predicted methyltransferase
MHRRLTPIGKASLTKRAAVALVAFVAACGTQSPTSTDPTPAIHAAVADPERTDTDRATDLRRHPEQLLAFAGVRPGIKVLDMGAGGGYSTELLARVVGPTGVVYGQDVKQPSPKAAAAFGERMKKPALRNVVRLERDFDDPVPADVRDLDLITFFFYYHDTAYMPVDRAQMDRRLFDALKPGGVLVIADHSARPGEGVSVVKTLHRIEEQTLRQEVEAAGFRLVAEGDFLRHPEDPRDEPVFRPKVPVDEFVLKFVKPG